MFGFLDSFRGAGMEAALFKLAVACLCGASIGVERLMKNSQAGIVTHLLICLGGTLASLTGHYVYLVSGIQADVSRIGAQVLSSLGFLGTGTIIVLRNGQVQGLRTASGLWAVGVIGVSIGAGFFEGAILVTVLVLVTRILHGILTQGRMMTTCYDVAFGFSDKGVPERFEFNLVRSGISICSREYYETDGVYRVRLRIRVNRRNGLDELRKHISREQGMEGITIHEAYDYDRIREEYCS